MHYGSQKVTYGNPLSLQLHPRLGAMRRKAYSWWHRFHGRTCEGCVGDGLAREEALRASEG